MKIKTKSNRPLRIRKFQEVIESKSTREQQVEDYELIEKEMMKYKKYIATFRKKTDMEITRQNAIYRLASLLYSLGSSQLDVNSMLELSKRIYQKHMQDLPNQLKTRPQYKFTDTLNGIPIFDKDRKRFGDRNELEDVECYIRHSDGETNYIKTVFGRSRDKRVTFDIPEFSISYNILSRASSSANADTYELGMSMEPSMQQESNIVCAYDTILSEQEFERTIKTQNREELAHKIKQRREEMHMLIVPLRELKPQQDEIAREKMLSIARAIKSYVDDSSLKIGNLGCFIQNARKILNNLEIELNG